MNKISMSELYSKIDKLGKDEVVLDVRTPDEFHAGHVPGSLNISHDEVEKHVSKLKSYKHVFIHCRGGGRAQKAWAILAEAGLDNLVCVSGSGMKDWLEAGYPVEK